MGYSFGPETGDALVDGTTMIQVTLTTLIILLLESKVDSVIFCIPRAQLHLQTCLHVQPYSTSQSLGAPGLRAAGYLPMTSTPAPGRTPAPSPPTPHHHLHHLLHDVLYQQLKHLPHLCFSGPCLLPLLGSQGFWKHQVLRGVGD